MTSDSDDLEQQLRQNLELRRELVALVGRGGSSLRRGRFWLGSQASKQAKHLCLAGKRCPLWRRHHIVSCGLIVDCRNL